MAGLNKKIISIFISACLFAPMPLFAEMASEASFDTDSPLVSLEFNNAPLQDVLKMLSQQSGYNFVATQDVRDKLVTVYFENAPVGDAIKAIVNANGLRYEMQDGGRMFVVKSSVETEQDMETRVFRLKYARLALSPMDIGGAKTIKDLKKKEEFKSGLGGSSSGGGAGGGGSASGGSSEEDSGGSEDISTNIPSNLVARRGVDVLVASLLSEKGRVTMDILTNTLIVTDFPSRLKKVESVLKEIDVPSDQVVLEVYIMEIKKNNMGDYGIEWGGADGKLAQFTAGNRTTGFPFTEGFLNGDGFKAQAVSGPSTLTLGSIDAQNFKAVLHFLTTQTDTKILARPRILTMNNEAAQIKLVTNAAIANQTLNTSTQGIATSTSNQAERTEAGISLKMTPQVNADETVGLFLEPSVTTLSSSAFFGSTFVDPTTRTIRTMARVKNNDTLVIAGLIDSDRSLSNKKVPLLGDIPGIGTAFSYKNKDEIERELIIFITPHILRGGMLVENNASDTDVTSYKRMTHAFQDQELQRNLAYEQDMEMDKALLLKHDKNILNKRSSSFVTPNSQDAMTQALDSPPNTNYSRR